MTATSAQTALVHQLTTPNGLLLEKGHYRSKLFITPKACNSILSAAGPIFSLLERLGGSQSLPGIETLWQNLSHELKAFLSRLQSFETSPELLGLAHYLMSATMDELLSKSYLRICEEPPEFRAFTPTTGDGIGPEQRFFDIVNIIKARPNQYLDLIELAYYCLISGFEGQEHLNASGRQNLDNLIEELHELIKQHRVSKPVKLFTKPKPFTQDAPVDHKPWIKAATFIVGVLLCSYFLTETLLENKAKTILSAQSTFYTSRP